MRRHHLKTSQSEIQQSLSMSIFSRLNKYIKTVINYLLNLKKAYSWFFHIKLCPSLTFWVQLLILAILRIWNRLKGLCLKITIVKKERKISYYLCRYQHLEVNAWSIMNCVHVKYKGDTFLSIHLGLIKWDHFAKIWYIYITCKNKFTEKLFTVFVGRWKSS